MQRLQWSLLLVLVITALYAIATTLIGKQLSYSIGFDWQITTNENNTVTGWQVVRSEHESLPINTLLTHVRIDQQWITLNHLVLPQTLDLLPSIQQFKQAIEIDQKLYDARNSRISFKTDNNKLIYLTPRPSNWEDLSKNFWLYRVILISCLLLGLACLYMTFKLPAHSADKSQTSSNLKQSCFLAVLVFCPLGLSIGASISDLDRHWGIPAYYINYAFNGNVIMLAIFELSLFKLLTINPANLFKQHRLWRYIWWVALISHVLNVIFISLRLDFAFDFHHCLFSILPICFLSLFIHQWLHARRKGSLIDKLSIRNVLVFNALILIMLISVDYLVKQYGLNSGITPTVVNAFGGILISASMLVLVFRQKLYQLAYWWWLLYSLFSGGAVFILVLMFTSNMGKDYQVADVIISLAMGVSISMGMAFWFQYRLIRFSVKTLHKSSYLLQELKQTDINTELFWQNQKALFMQALDIKEAEVIDTNAHEALIIESGEQLQISITNKKGLLLSAPDKGRRLFSEQDIKTILLLRDLATQQQREKQAFSEGEKQTRKQVAHDLHDDIGGRLHQLAHGDTKNAADYAQRTLEQLRTLTHALHKESQEITLFLANLKHDMLRHAQSCDIDMSFNASVPETMQNQTLSAMAMVQFNSIMSELCRNALQHQGVTNVAISIEFDDENTRITAANDGAKTWVKDWVTGVGTVSIKRRVHQLDGKVNWIENPEGGVTVQMTYKTKTWLAL